ncbi:hypothetical protein BKA69DRAFT_1084287 [Paraphysoderma sedebokerense]|nr:hypothetical protein BKA69DRAFT_1084287 [Paraphysoderma sedebokerense]
MFLVCHNRSIEGLPPWKNPRASLTKQPFLKVIRQSSRPSSCKNSFMSTLSFDKSTRSSSSLNPGILGKKI